MDSSFSCSAIFEKYRLKVSAVFWVFFISLVPVVLLPVLLLVAVLIISHVAFTLLLVFYILESLYILFASFIMEDKILQYLL